MRSCRLEETSVLPMAASLPHSRAPPKRYQAAAARKWLGLSSPAAGVTTPKRSASASLPRARSKSSRRAMSRAMAYGEDGSMRILPSQSRVMKPKVGSTRSFVMVSVDAVPLGDGGPVGHRRAAQRVDADAQAASRDGGHVDDARRGRRRSGPGSRSRPAAARASVGRDAGDAVEPGAQQLVGGILDGPRDAGVGRPAARRVVLEAAIGGRVVRRRHDDAVGERLGVLAVPGQDGVRDGRGRREAVGAVDAHVDARRPPAPRGPSGRPARRGRACRGP